ncbi:hypothetical protein DFH09DRAFT_1323386 [Mycena vulgaris]|nr:hypothetical protein DFH09DRAFT_1323386 [Mycena vulgaris]
MAKRLYLGDGRFCAPRTPLIFGGHRLAVRGALRPEGFISYLNWDLPPPPSSPETQASVRRPSYLGGSASSLCDDVAVLDVAKQQMWCLQRRMTDDEAPNSLSGRSSGGWCAAGRGCAGSAGLECQARAETLSEDGDNEELAPRASGPPRRREDRAGLEGWSGSEAEDERKGYASAAGLTGQRSRACEFISSPSRPLPRPQTSTSVSPSERRDVRRRSARRPALALFTRSGLVSDDAGPPPPLLRALLPLFSAPTRPRTHCNVPSISKSTPSHSISKIHLEAPAAPVREVPHCFKWRKCMNQHPALASCPLPARLV